jgi:hypothetical protein
VHSTLTNDHFQLFSSHKKKTYLRRSIRLSPFVTDFIDKLLDEVVYRKTVANTAGPEAMATSESVLQLAHDFFPSAIRKVRQYLVSDYYCTLIPLFGCYLLHRACSND